MQRDSVIRDLILRCRRLPPLWSHIIPNEQVVMGTMAEHRRASFAVQVVLVCSIIANLFQVHILLSATVLMKLIDCIY